MPTNQRSNHQQKIELAVIGIGRVGLPLAMLLAKEGLEVVGVDVDKARLESVRAGKVPFIEKGGDELLSHVYGHGLVAVHEDALSYVLPKMQAVILTLGTTIDSSLSPSVAQITEFFDKFGGLLQKGQLIVLRSTVTPGTTEFVARFIKEKLGWEVGKDIYLACCPERIAEGNALTELYEIPQIIGAADEGSRQRAAQIFSRLTDQLLYTDPRSAELAKLYCNMYRYIDFAIGNEFMLIADSHERDIYEVLRLVNQGYKRGGVKGPGFTAGACLVKDGFFLIEKSPYLDLIAGAWRVNESIPAFVVNKIKKSVPKLAGLKVALLGLGFKRNIDDTRYSLSLKLQQYLYSEGAEVVCSDPFIASAGVEESLKDADVLIMAVNHDLYKELDRRLIVELVKPDCFVCDIWNLFGQDKITFSVRDLEIVEKTASKLAKPNGLVQYGVH